MGSADEFLPLTGVVRTTEGYRTIRKGDQLPDNLAEGEEERLRRIGAYGEPPAPAAEASVLSDASDEELAAFVGEHTANEVVEAAGDDPALAERLLTAEQDGKDRKTAVEGLEAIADAE